MAGPTQFRQYLISQDAEGNNIEVVRTADQVGVLAFDVKRHIFVHCHVLLEAVKNRRSFDDRAKKFKQSGHPRLARLLESGEDEGSYFYVTVNADGETLRGYLGRHEQIPVWLAMKLTALALEAVHAALSVGDFLPPQLMDVLRLVQTGPQELTIILTDYRLTDADGSKTAKARLAKSAFDKQEQFLGVFFLERLRTGSSMQEAMLGTADFTELLTNLLASCGQGVEEGIANVLKALAKSTPAPPPGELAAQLKPRPLLVPLLNGFADVARSVSGQVRIQSQRLEASQPYAMRGTFTKTGQNVVVEQVPPWRLAANSPAEALKQVLNLPKMGKFPNIVPIIFVEENDGLLCAAEAAVEGISLSELLAARGTLDIQEVYLVLAGMDAALAQLEKTQLDSRRLRLEDIFLFTGFGKVPANNANLLSQKLNEWPGFSIVLRAHPCLSSMSGRGTDAAMLLPSDVKPKSEAETVWNGAWMASLGCFLTGMTSGEAVKHLTGIEEVDATFRMFEDELARGRKGSPTNRADFLARYARVMQHHDLAHTQNSGGFWAELSGTGAAQGRAAEIARASAPAPSTPKMPAAIPAKAASGRSAPLHPAEHKPHIGFAEALIRQPQIGESEEAPGGLHTMRAGMRRSEEDFESSWRPMHAETPLWLKGLVFVGGSLMLGAALAHLSGRALWQQPAFSSEPPRAVAVEEPMKVAEPTIDLPVARQPSAATPPSSTSSTPAAPKLAPPTAPLLSALDLEPRPAPSPTTKAAMTSAAPSPSPSTLDPVLNEKLVELRKTAGRMPVSLRTQTDRAARNGSTEAMLALGRMHLRGESVPVDQQMALSWFQKALDAGDENAATPLAECYLQGWGTAPDFTRGAELLTRAATAGDASAKDQLALCYANGRGVMRDDAKAYALCSEAYAAGVTTACGNLGAMYLRGQGVAQDAERAVLLFSEGARRGHANSMFLYAQCLEYGTGTPANREQATHWYQQAARLGNAEAANWCREKGASF